MEAASTADHLLDALRTLAWPVTVLLLVWLFRAQLRERLASLRRAELPGGVRFELDALRRDVAATPEFAASREATSPPITPDGTLPSDRLYPLARVQLDIDWLLRRFARSALRDPDFAIRGLNDIILDLRDAGELSGTVARQLQDFMRLSEAGFSRSELSDDEMAALVTVGTMLASHAHYLERVASITTDIWGHDLMRPLMHLERGDEENPKFVWAVVATILPEVDYNYQLFTDAIRRAASDESDRNWPKGMAPLFLKLRVSRADFVEVTKFRRDELRRLLRDGEGHWWEQGSQDWRYFEWPPAWGKIPFNLPVARGMADDVARELLQADSALRRMRHRASS